MNKKNTFYFFVLSFLFINACTKPEPNFDLNGDDIGSSTSEPSDFKDSALVKRIFPNDTIILSDISHPEDKVKKRFWDTDDNGEWDEAFQDKDFIKVRFEEEGFHKIVFCANNTENCITKWVYVLTPFILEEDQSPKFIVFERKIYTDERSYKVEVGTENIFSKEEVNVKVDGKDHDFEFDSETQKISVSLAYLKREKGYLVEIEANTLDGVASEALTVIREKKEVTSATEPAPPKSSTGGPAQSPKPTPSQPSTGASTQPPKPVPSQPSDSKSSPTVKIMATSTYIKTRQSTYELKIRTTNLLGKNGLTINQNGKSISDFKFSPDEKAWVVKFPLDQGKNTIEAIARNGVDEKSDKIVIEYEVEEELANLGVAGLEISKYDLNCSTPTVEDYTFSITPNQTVELLSFTIFSDICGGLEVEMKSSEGSDKTTVILVKGRNQISLLDLQARLKPGIRYSFSCKTIASFGTCNAKQTPKILNATSCANQPIAKPEFKMDYQGKSIIYDLKYFY